MDSLSGPSLAPSILAGIKQALSYGLVSVVASTGVYGITVLQAWTYFRNSGKDSVGIRAFVAFLFILDTLSLGFGVNSLYDYVITDYGDPLLLLNTPVAAAFENALTVMIGTLTQCFFAYCLWALRVRNVLLVNAIIILALLSFGPGMVLSVNLYTHRDIFYLSTTKTRLLAGVANGLSVLCDVFIAAALSYYLNSKRTGFRRTDSIIDRLIIYAVNRGALTATCQAGQLITTVGFPGHFIFLPFALLTGKLYCNTLLATYVIGCTTERLNAQKSMNGNNVVEVDTGMLNRLNLSMAGNGSSLSSAVGSERVAEDEGAINVVLDISAPKPMDCTHA